jgi:phage gp45-like
MLTMDRTNGVVIGLLLGFRDGAPLVVFAGNDSDQAIAARSLTHLSANDVGSEVALLFEDGRKDSPLIIGCIMEPVRLPTEVRPEAPVVKADDDQPIVIKSRRSLEFRCGKASIVMKADGRVTIRGTQILTRAERTNRVQGATVALN